MSPKSPKTLKIVLIGCGRIAGHHCRAVKDVDGVELVAVCDLETDKAEAYAQEFDVPAFTNYRQMFEDIADIAIAAVITPSGMHLEHGLEMLNDYAKHVIMEKPTFMRPGDLDCTFEAAHAVG